MQITIHIHPPAVATKKRQQKPVSAKDRKQQRQRAIYKEQPIDTLPVIGFQDEELTEETEES
jgi:hypothetical protein